MEATQSSAKPFAAAVVHPLKTDVEALTKVISAAEIEHGWGETIWLETDEADAGLSAAKQAAAAGAAVVFASGGDGTIRAVAEGLRGSGVPLAVIPQGTGNLLARNLGVPLTHLTEVVQAGFTGVDTPIDLGVLTITRADRSSSDHVFLVLAGMGLDARAITATRSSLKKRVGWLAYVDAGLRTLIRDSALELQYSADGSPSKRMSVYTIMIGNCGLLPGGVLLIPEAKFDDGKLDVVALRPLGAFAWLKIWHKLSWENGVLRKSKTGRRMINLTKDTRAVKYMKVTDFSLTVREEEPIQLDGDDFGMAIAARSSVDPAALIVRVLPNWSRADES